MREIKFRAWDKKGRVMHVVSTMHFSDEGDGLFSAEEIQVHYNHEWIEIDKDGYILMQYTGLKDSKGKEIWEGDILQLAKTKALMFRRVVVFAQGCFGYYDLTGEFIILLRALNANKWKKIGNKYQDPELWPQPNKENTHETTRT